jgi:GntR family transcriptional repressor for pyruvate dehydrogenase complex
MPKDSFRQVQRSDRLSIQVANQIEELILSGILKIGEKLPPERELCEQFGVSRTVVREAVRVLEAKGLLKSQSGSGTYVRALKSLDVANSLGMYLSTHDGISSYGDLMEVRRILEVQIAAIAAERAVEDCFVKLEAVLDQMKSAMDDPQAFAKHDLQFHVTLAHCTGNELLAAVLDPFADAMYEAVLASNLPDPPEWNLEVHRRIFERVKARDAEGAAKAMAYALDQEKPV